MMWYYVYDDNSKALFKAFQFHHTRISYVICDLLMARLSGSL